MALPPSTPSPLYPRSMLVRDLLTDIAGPSAFAPSGPRSLFQRLISVRDLLTVIAGPSAFAASTSRLLAARLMFVRDFHRRNSRTLTPNTVLLERLPLSMWCDVSRPSLPCIPSHGELPICPVLHPSFCLPRGHRAKWRSICVGYACRASAERAHRILNPSLPKWVFLFQPSTTNHPL